MAKTLYATTVKSPYVTDADRFVVSLVVGYGKEGITKDPLEAAKSALSLTRDADSGDTQWHVLDRNTGVTYIYDQSEMEE